jgi:hypothetical protein
VDHKTPREVIDIIATTKNLVVDEHDGLLYVSSAPFRIPPIVIGVLALATFPRRLVHRAAFPKRAHRFERLAPWGARAPRPPQHAPRGLHV